MTQQDRYTCTDYGTIKPPGVYSEVFTSTK